eukprot:CCRYP_008045-RA/>CCRYP_008045-RA protein AED:0.29 eAED:0.29 QI:587/1/1/1/0/0/2/683/307
MYFKQANTGKGESRDDGDANTNLTALAIVPYCPDSHQHPWSQSRPPMPLSQELPKRQTVNDKSRETLTTRQKEVTAIRKHLALERHESIDSSTQSGVFGSASAGTLPDVARLHPMKTKSTDRLECHAKNYWTSNSNFSSNQLSAFSFDHTGEDSSADWGSFPSHRTISKPVYSLRSSCEHSGGEKNDSDVSEWTKNLDGSESQSLQWDSNRLTVDDTDEKKPSEDNESFHNVNSQFRTLIRQESLELERRPHRNATQNNVANGKRNHPQSTSSSPYKYQICFFIQMQLCHPMALADWIKRVMPVVFA